MPRTFLWISFSSSLNRSKSELSGEFENIQMERLTESNDKKNAYFHRNSHMLTPKIIKFLFYLAKQKEKPQMSIPKIINITDNLLANSITKNGSIEALFQLAFEVYFPRCIETDLNDSQQNRKELNTQKEVVFSMLLKFIDCFEVNRIYLIKTTENFSKFSTNFPLSRAGEEDDLFNFAEGNECIEGNTYRNGRVLASNHRRSETICRKFKWLLFASWNVHANTKIVGQRSK